MFFPKFWTASALLLAMMLSLGPALAVDQITFTGDVTYRERMALPPDADLRVTLVSLDGSGAPRIVGASAPLSAPGQVPLHFELNVRSDAISPDKTYGLIAEIRSGGVAVFRNRNPVRVDPALPQPVLIMVNFDPQPRPAEPPMNDHAALYETIWSVRDIAGKAVLAATELSLSIATDHRAGGNGGCNNYFTEAILDGAALRFGPVAGTRMACEPRVMQQEAAFFGALGATASYDVAGKTLSLRDADGNQLVRLVRQ